MKWADVSTLLAEIPFTPPDRGKILYDFIIKEQPNLCLELGHAHGVTSCYIAAALEENGHGQLHVRHE